MQKNLARKIIFLLTALLILSCGSLVYAEAKGANVVESGTTSSGATWTLDAEGTLSISGTGETGVFDATFLQSKVKKVVIEKTEIQAQA